jgi:ribosomal protein S18 acetylase RimI-like enzyme
MQLITRSAQPSDLLSLRKLAIDSFSQAYGKFNTEQDMQNYLSENFSEEKLLKEINAGEILVGIQNEKIAAYAKLISPDATKCPGDKALEIARLYTDTRFIGQGLGTQMLQAIFNLAQQQGKDSVCLDVWQKNFRAINFYQREGFRICGLTQFRLGDDVQDDFVMIHRLR